MIVFSLSLSLCLLSSCSRAATCSSAPLRSRRCTRRAILNQENSEIPDTSVDLVQSISSPKQNTHKNSTSPSFSETFQTHSLPQCQPRRHGHPPRLRPVHEHRARRRRRRQDEAGHRDGGEELLLQFSFSFFPTSHLAEEGRKLTLSSSSFPSCGSKKKKKITGHPRQLDRDDHGPGAYRRHIIPPSKVGGGDSKKKKRELLPSFFCSFLLLIKNRKVQPSVFPNTACSLPLAPSPTVSVRREALKLLVLLVSVYNKKEAKFFPFFFLYRRGTKPKTFFFFFFRNKKLGRAV